jgi:hypothetical protein
MLKPYFKSYPNGEGRKMSWKGIEELKNKLV